MRRLWGRANSSNVMKVLWLLEELSLPYERIDAGGAFGKTDSADYRAMNPTGLVPTLQEGDFVLWESNAIVRYLASAQAGDSPLWPHDVRARASIDRWMDCQQTQLNRPQSVLFWGLVRTPPEKRDPAVIHQAIADAQRAYSLLETSLTRLPFIAGEAFTLADIVWGVHVHRWFSMDFERPDLPWLRAWYDRLLQRPAYQTQCAGPMS
jgi:glutathione S-transferase